MSNRTEQIQPLGQDKFEREFSVQAVLAGFMVQLSPSISCEEPVADKNGEVKKTKTTPDFLVTNQATNEVMFVDVTRGSGCSPSKFAQKRVVAAAGVENYRKVTGEILELLMSISEPAGKRAVLLQLFDWFDP